MKLLVPTLSLFVFLPMCFANVLERNPVIREISVRDMPIGEALQYASELAGYKDLEIVYLPPRITFSVEVSEVVYQEFILEQTTRITQEFLADEPPADPFAPASVKDDADKVSDVIAHKQPKVSIYLKNLNFDLVLHYLCKSVNYETRYDSYERCLYYYKSATFIFEEIAFPVWLPVEERDDFVELNQLMYGWVSYKEEADSFIIVGGKDSQKTRNQWRCFIDAMGLENWNEYLDRHKHPEKYKSKSSDPFGSALPIHLRF